jgi:hypothetical protein
MKMDGYCSGIEKIRGLQTECSTRDNSPSPRAGGAAGRAYSLDY